MLVYNGGLNSLTESLYIKAGLTKSLDKSDVVVNPTSDMKYIGGKVIIINLATYDEKLLNRFEKRNTVIYRVPMFDREVEPYTLESIPNLVGSNIKNYTILTQSNIELIPYTKDPFSNIFYVNQFSYIKDETHEGYLNGVGHLAYQLNLKTLKLNETIKELLQKDI